VVFDVFDLVQDGKTNDNANRQLSKTKIIPFFTLTSFFIDKFRHKSIKNAYYNKDEEKPLSTT